MSQRVTEKARKLSPRFQRVTEKDRKIWLLSQLVTELYFEIDVIFKIDSRTVDQDIQIFLQNVNIYPTTHPQCKFSRSLAFGIE